MHIIHLSHESLEVAAKKAAMKLSDGDRILYPTDTVYGLGVDGLNVTAIQHLHKLKGRPPVWPTLVIVADIDSIEKYAVLNDAARALAEKFLPGPLSLILPAKDTIPSALTLNNTIGIRIPNDPFCLELARQFGRPFTTTRANRTRRETPTNVHDIIKQFGHDAHDISLAIDDGDRNGKGSTIVSCLTDTPHLVREGAISRAELGI